jgi:mannosyltransferase OCH1-like enzyme
VIYQTWKTRDNIPKDLALLREEWMTSHPDYVHILLDDSDLREIVRTIDESYLADYDSFTSNIERVDFARYAIMYLYGGVYADLDTRPLKRIDFWVEKNVPVLGCEPSEHSRNLYHLSRVVCNALMISPPGNRFWLDLMECIRKNYERNYDPVENTGPLAITRFLDQNPQYESQIIITDSCVFYPLVGDRTVSKECLGRESYVQHVWKNSWVEPWYRNKKWKNARLMLCTVLIIYILMWGYLYFV